MTQSSTKADQQYKCDQCDKLFVRKGNLSNHLRNVHNQNDSPTPDGFLDNTSYSEELDTENTVLLDFAREEVACDFFGNISDNESEDGIIMDNNTVKLITSPTPGLNSTPRTAAPVPLCPKANSYISSKWKTLPASFLTTLLPAASFLEDINKSLQEEDDELQVQVNDLLKTFETEIRCQMCHICGLTFTGNNKLNDHITGTHKERFQSPTQNSTLPNLGPKGLVSVHAVPDPNLTQPSLGDYLSSMKDMISQQSVMIEKLLALHESKYTPSPTMNPTCNKCNTKTQETDTVEKHNRPKHINKVIECPMCSYKNKSESTVMKHIADQHPDSYSCKNCQEKFKTRSDLDGHMKINHLPEKEPPIEIVDIEDNDEESGWNLIVGDSHIKSLNMRKLENALKGKRLSNPAASKPREASAYTTTKYWPNAKWPESNLEDRVPQLLSEKKYSNLIVLTPSNNLKNIEDMPENEQNQMAIDTPCETLSIVEKALKDNPTLKTAVIVELPPRNDSYKLSELTEFSNFVLKGAVKKSKYRNQISIATLDAMYDYSDKDIFGSQNYFKYDGIHMHGKLGKQVYSNSILMALESAGLTSTEPSIANSPVTTSNRYSALSN